MAKGSQGFRYGLANHRTWTRKRPPILPMGDGLPALGLLALLALLAWKGPGHPLLARVALASSSNVK